MDDDTLSEIFANARNGMTFPEQIEARPPALWVTVTTYTGVKLRHPPESFHVVDYNLLSVLDNSGGFDNLTYINISSIVAVNLAFTEVAL